MKGGKEVGAMIIQETLAVTIAEKKREISQLRAVREAQRAARPPTRDSQRGWSWRVEPGMGEAFTSLRGWLLSRAGGGRTEYVPNGTESS